VNDFNLGNIFIGFYTNTTQFSGGSYWQRYNNKFFSQFKHVKGNFFSAGEFGGTADGWGVTFSIYEKSAEELEPQDYFTLSLEESVIDAEKGVYINKLGNKHMRRVEVEDSLTVFEK